MTPETITIRGDDYNSNSVAARYSLARIAGLGSIVPSAILFQTKPHPQAYFWTPEWQVGETEAEEDIAAGNTRVFSSIGEAIEWLESDDES